MKIPLCIDQHLHFSIQKVVMKKPRIHFGATNRAKWGMWWPLFPRSSFLASEFCYPDFLKKLPLRQLKTEQNVNIPLFMDMSNHLHPTFHARLLASECCYPDLVMKKATNTLWRHEPSKMGHVVASFPRSLNFVIQISWKSCL